MHLLIMLTTFNPFVVIDHILRSFGPEFGSLAALTGIVATVTGVVQFLNRKHREKFEKTWFQPMVDRINESNKATRLENKQQFEEQQRNAKAMHEESIAVTTKLNELIARSNEDAREQRQINDQRYLDNEKRFESNTTRLQKLEDTVEDHESRVTKAETVIDDLQEKI